MRRRLLVALSPVALACASSRAAEPIVESDPKLVPYRLVTKSDFQSLTSNSLWGNVAHGAEICTAFLPDLEAGAVEAVMKQDCSFWNRTHRLRQAGGLVLGAVTGVFILPRQQPDWYILQHEQIHFAIMKLEALKLSERIAALAPERRTASVVQQYIQEGIANVQSQHAKFDSHTSGVYDPAWLESWVRVLERNLAERCACPVRIPTG